MKLPLFNVRSLGTVHPEGYWFLILMLMLGLTSVLPSVLVFLTLAVPVAESIRREPRIFWTPFAIISVVAAVTATIWQCSFYGAAGLMFYWVQGEFGLPLLGFNGLTLLLTCLAMLPLSASSALSSLRCRQKRHDAETNLGQSETTPNE